MVQRSTVARITENRFLAAGIALLVIAVAVAFALINDNDETLGSKLAEGHEPPATSASGPTPAATDGATTPGGAAVGSPAGASGAIIPGLQQTPGVTPCTARKVTAPGVTDKTITVGQIVTDSNNLPQQLRPAHEGLQAFVNAFNESGGLCGRRLQIEYRNDNLNPATHNQDARELASRVLAFVANESLLDFLDYQREPPFEPTVQGGGGKVPDVGGLAFGYGRAQSAWHAGVIGSVSPTLVGGGQYKFFLDEQRRKGTPCRKGGVVYLNEPTGASQDQARLGAVSIEESWGGGLGRGKTTEYEARLLDPVQAYEALVDRMVADGMNCAFTYTDLQSSINMAKAMRNQGVWPPDKCRRGNKCFRLFSVVLSVYDRKFIQDAGDAARSVSTFIPHVPLVESSHPAMKVYIDALRTVRGAHASTFSILGFASGIMLIEALQPCREAPTRACLINSLRKMQNFNGGGLLGGITPFRRTRATFGSYGTFDWKWIFNTWVIMRVSERNGKRDFYRVGPSSGFGSSDLHVARGTPR